MYIFLILALILLCGLNFTLLLVFLQLRRIQQTMNRQLVESVMSRAGGLPNFGGL